MDGRDLARCLALEASNETFAYTVSLEHGATYSTRHLTANFNRPNFCREIKKRWGKKIRFRQIILDYFWIPSGSWAMTHWSRSFFDTTLPSFATEDLIDTSTGEGIIFLPFSLHCMTQVVAARSILRKYYFISYLYKDELSEHALWKATSSICSNTMQAWLGKAINQEEIYCTFNIRNVDNSAMDNGYITKDELMNALNQIENVEQVRMIKLQVRKNWRRKGSCRGEEKKEDFMESNSGKYLENHCSLYADKKLGNSVCQTNRSKIATGMTEKINKVRNKNQRRLSSSIKKQVSLKGTPQTVSSSKDEQTLRKSKTERQKKYDLIESTRRKVNKKENKPAHSNNNEQEANEIEKHLIALTAERLEMSKISDAKDDARVSDGVSKSATKNISTSCESFLKNTKHHKRSQATIFYNCDSKKLKRRKLKHSRLTYNFKKSKIKPITGRKQMHKTTNCKKIPKKLAAIPGSKKSSKLTSCVIKKKIVVPTTYFCRPKIFWTGSSFFKHSVKRPYPNKAIDIQSIESISREIKEIVNEREHEYSLFMYNKIDKDSCEEKSGTPIELPTKQPCINDKSTKHPKTLNYDGPAHNKLNMDQASTKKLQTSTHWCISTKDGSIFQENVHDAANVLLKLKCNGQKSSTEQVSCKKEHTPSITQRNRFESECSVKSRNSFCNRKNSAAQNKQKITSKSKKSSSTPLKKRTICKSNENYKKKSQKEGVRKKLKRTLKRKPVDRQNYLDEIGKTLMKPKESFRSINLFDSQESKMQLWNRPHREIIRDPVLESLLSMSPVLPYQPSYNQTQNEASLIPKLRQNLIAMRRYQENLIYSYNRFCADLYSKESLHLQQDQNSFLQQPSNNYINCGNKLNLPVDRMSLLEKLSRSQSTPFHS